MKRTVLNLQQGTPEWLAARASSDGTASEAPAMKGKSKYQSRQELLTHRKTGITKDVDSFTQAIFNKGHDTEAKARPLAEEIIGDELSATTIMVEIDGLKLLASLDGITFDDSVIFEHKLWNESLAEQVRSGQLEEHYTIQMDQELLVSGASKCLFMVSDGTRDKNVSMWYESSQEKFDALIAGWKQFHKDLADYVPPVQVEKVEAETVQALPVPSVVVRGEVTVSNLNEITPMFDDYLGSIKTEFSTDQDFADAEANGDNCEETEKRIKALRENIIAQMVDINTIDRTLGNYQEAFRKMKVLLKNAVKEQKDNIKTTAIMKAKVAYADFVSELNKDISVMLSRRLVCPDFAAAIKGVQKLDSMHSRINDALAAGKTEATTLANDIKTKLAYIAESAKGYEHLINNHELAFADIDYIKLYLDRVKADEDNRNAEREAAIKLQAEADAKAKLEAEAKVIADQLASADKPMLGHPDMSAGVGRLGSENAMVNEADFSKHIVGVDLATGEDKTVVTNIGKRPTAEAIINLVATTYSVDKPTAQRWLTQSFAQAKAA